MLLHNPKSLLLILLIPAIWLLSTSYAPAQGSAPVICDTCPPATVAATTPPDTLTLEVEDSTPLPDDGFSRRFTASKYRFSGSYFPKKTEEIDFDGADPRHAVHRPQNGDTHPLQRPRPEPGRKNRLRRPPEKD